MKYKVPPRRFALSYSIRQILKTRARALVWAALLLLAVCCVAQAKPSFTVQPPPAWVQPVTAPSSDAGTRAKDAESGVRFLLDDRQTRVSGKGVEGYFHFVEVVSTAAAVEKFS